MAYNEYLQERIERILNDKSVVFQAKKMMGGLCYMVDNKMCFGIVKDDFMARVGIEASEKLLEKHGARPMDFTKRPMKGYLFVAPEGVDFEEDLPKAKSSKKR
jgi:TfoX/Sxy family transcriptional regulator of competence genes